MNRTPRHRRERRWRTIGRYADALIRYSRVNRRRCNPAHYKVRSRLSTACWRCRCWCDVVVVGCCCCRRRAKRWRRARSRRWNTLPCLSVGGLCCCGLLLGGGCCCWRCAVSGVMTSWAGAASRSSLSSISAISRSRCSILPHSSATIHKTLIHRVKWRNCVVGHDTIAILWV